MQKSIFKEKYFLFSLRIEKREVLYRNVDEIIEYFKEQITKHTTARFLCVFDHYKHTESLKDGVIAPQIKEAKNICLCFGKKLESAEMLAVRPRSIGICDIGEEFVISFMEAPNFIANDTMESWCLGLKSCCPV